ncbi:ATP-binding protein [Streptomyces sp. MS2.AVA.5]|uniref:ATP-binding protein n=1 Tax=Streptomyces achmelvichensis TaxID=3134111 RepID=A0ACC6Q675_9ACTN
MTTHRAATPPHPGMTDCGPTAASSAPTVSPLASRAFEMVMASASIHVAQARGTTAAVLRQWALPDAPAEDAQLVVSELVTNAISHGSGAVGLRVRYGNHQLRIEVTDGSTTPAKRRRAGANDPGGRGLLLVAHLSHRWGVADSGRTTYAVIPTLPEAPPCRRTAQPTLDPTC